jgi:hypothetical protein
MPGNWGLIDLDTPKDAYTHPPFTASGKDWQLIFSDEFNVDGRTFYPGDDPYWEAVDLHYWGTNNMEWYDPAAITTENGALKITLTAKETHGLHYQGGMMSTWNKFCFTGGMILTSVTLPGINNIVGLWPAIWTMGNLGRAGYGASLDGTVSLKFDQTIGTPILTISRSTSGHIRMMHAMLALSRIKRLMGCLLLLLSMETSHMGECCPTCLANVFHAALVLESLTLVQCMRMALMWGVRRPKSIFLRRRSRMGSVKCRSRASGRFVFHSACLSARTHD